MKVPYDENPDLSKVLSFISTGALRDLSYRPRKDRLLKAVSELKPRYRHCEPPKFPLGIALLKRAACVVRAQLDVRSAAGSVWLKSASGRERL